MYCKYQGSKRRETAVVIPMAPGNSAFSKYSATCPWSTALISTLTFVRSRQHHKERTKLQLGRISSLKQRFHLNDAPGVKDPGSGGENGRATTRARFAGRSWSPPSSTRAIYTKNHVFGYFKLQHPELSSKKQKPNVEQPANVGISRSARAVRAVMDAVRHGSFVVNEVKQEAWKAYIRITDPRAEFFDDNIRKVRHSACGKSFLVKNPYDQNRWDNHINKACPAKPSKKHPLKPSAGASTLPKIASVSGWKKKGATVEPQHVPVDDKPCPGITPKDAPNLRKYLHRTGAPGGGARSAMKIAMAKFGKVFSVLNKRGKKEVLDTQYHEHAWRNDHANLRNHRSGQPSTHPSLQILLRGTIQKSVQEGSQKDAPAPENYIYVNKKYRNKALGDLYARTIGLQDIIEASDAKNTPCIRYAQGVLEGKYNDQVFSGLVEAMVTKIDREERGVGMQNFDHAPAWDESRGLSCIAGASTGTL
ncbi:hypothetical protein B0H10DRAFT_2390685 [Mycena sp. CBHHK59/15]|nr:hypothetical protein B0H10DRAFT_2390685 [Mycena sp. CBHHK59/15]